MSGMYESLAGGQAICKHIKQHLSVLTGPSHFVSSVNTFFIVIADSCHLLKVTQFTKTHSYQSYSATIQLLCTIVVYWLYSCLKILDNIRL